MGIIIKKNKAQLDGYHIREDTDPGQLEHGTDTEIDDLSFPSEPQVGYHRTNAQEFFTNPQLSPYSRQFDTQGNLISCGLDPYLRHVQRLEEMLKVTGEPVILYRRKWTGEQCPCVSRINNQPRSRCPVCFGAGFVGGYVRTVNPKEPDGRIWMRVSPTQEDLELKEEGLWQKFEPQCWTLPKPILRDRDVIVRFNPDTKEEAWRYEVLNVTRNVGLTRKFYSQQYQMLRLDKTDPIYNIGLIDLENYGEGMLNRGPDSQQIKVEEKYGDGYNDKAYSQGYNTGYNKGYEAGLNGHMYIAEIDENKDQYFDEPYLDEAEAYGLDNFRMGYIGGYEDGYRDGAIERRNRGRG